MTTKVTNIYNLKLTPSQFGQNSIVVNCSQYDSLFRVIQFNLFNGNAVYSIPEGSVVTIRGTKKDNTGFEYECDYSNNVVTFPIQQQITIFPGKVPAELRIVNEGEIIGSWNFLFLVEESPLSDETIISETQLPLLEQAIEAADRLNEAFDDIAEFTDETYPNAVQAVQNEGATQVANVTNEGTTQKSLVTSEGSTQIANVQAEGTTQVSNVQAKGEEVLDSIPSDYTELSNTVKNLAGSENVLTPTKINGLNVVRDGQAYENASTQDAFYISAIQGGTYTWTTGKSSGQPYVRMAFSEQLPANGVPFTYIGEKQITSDPVAFSFVAPSDGYICESIYLNQTNADLMTIEETFEGTVDELDSRIGILESNVSNLDAKVDETSYAYTGDALPLNKQIINVKHLAEILNAESTFPSWIWAGGMAVYGDTAFLYYHQGWIVAFDLKTLSVIATGRASEASDNNHGNCISFDYQNVQGDFPIVYVSRGQAGGSECYVDKISITGTTITSTRMQTITYAGNLSDSTQLLDWVVDTDNRHLLMMINGNCAVFNLPSLTNQTISLTDSDIISQFTYPSAWTRQDCSVYNEHLFMSTGFANEGKISVISLADGTVKSTVDLVTTFSAEEPEGLCVYQNKIYVNTNNGHGLSLNLFEITI